MRALVLNAFGDVSGFELIELPMPQPASGEVRVRVAASGVNPVDVKIRRLGPFFAPRLPAVLGMDFAGVVDAVGPGVTQFSPGDAVFGCHGGVTGLPGTLAQYTVADARCLAKVPENLTMRQAAALPVVAMTAWQALFVRAMVCPGDHVLIHAGAGGVGHMAVQLATIAGARVATTVSTPEKATIAREFGARDIIYYRDEKPEDYTKRLTGETGFSLVFDTVGGDTLDASFIAAAASGTVVSTNSRASHDLTPVHSKGLTLHVVFLLLPMLTGLGRESYAATLTRIAALAEADKLTVLLDPHTFSLEEAGAAHALLESGKAVGKVVVDIS